MAAKGKKANKRESEAGQRNFAVWNKEHPERGNLKHGAHSEHVRKRYSDKRTKEGRQLSTIMDTLVNDLGGNSDITSAQRLLLDSIRSKIMVILQISKFVDRHESIIDSEGTLLPCLGKNFITYSESLRRDLEALFSVKRKSNSLSYEQVMRGLESGK